MFIGDKDVEAVRAYLRISGDVAGDPFRLVIQGTGSQALVTTTNGVFVNTWHHLCARCTAADYNEAILDANFANKGASVVNVGSIAAFDRIAIGATRDSTPTNYFSGLIAETAIWSAALTDAEVAALARGISPLRIRPESLVCYWPLVRTDQDLVGGYDLTAYNTPTIGDHAPMRMGVVPVFVGVPVSGAATLSINVHDCGPDVPVIFD